jgi:O-antigen/teichoic acid export membrane protein
MDNKDNQPVANPKANEKRGSGSFMGNVAKLASGATLSQLLIIASTPIVSRLFAPEAFGPLAVLASTMAFLGITGSLRYEMSIPLPEDDEEAANILGVCFANLLLTTTLVSVLIATVGMAIVDRLSMSELGPYLYTVPICHFINGMYISLGMWLTRTRRFGGISITRIGVASGQSIGSVGIGAAGMTSSIGLISCYIGGYAIGAASYVTIAIRNNWSLLKRISTKGMMLAYARYYRFPLYSIWADLLSQTSVQLPTFMLALYFNPEIVGLYSLGTRVVELPSRVVGQAIGQVFYQDASDAHREGQLAGLAGSMFSGLITIGFWPFLLLGVIGDSLFSIILGEEWRVAGEFVQILCIWRFFVFVEAPILALFNVTERQKAGAMFDIILTILCYTALLIGCLHHNVFLALELYVAAGVIVISSMTAHILMVSGVNIVSLLKNTGRPIVLSILLIIPLVFLKWTYEINEHVLLSLAIVASVAFYTYLLLTEPMLSPILTKIRRKLSV